MTDDKLLVYVMDDEPLARTIALDALNNPRYTVREFDGAAALLAAMDEAPDVVLLDIEMPDANGIDICRTLRAGGSQAWVLFVSCHDDLETRLAAYHAGGNDFVVKPCPPEELAEKVRLAEDALIGQRELSQRAQWAQQAAFTAMSSMGEMGVVLNFLRASYACRTPEQLAAAVFEALAQYGLQGLLGMRLSGGAPCFSSRGVCSPLEHSILSHAHSMDRIFQLRDRVSVNYPHTTLLALDLPLSDPDRVGRIRDHLAILMEGANARVAEIEHEAQRLAQAGGISRAVADLTQALGDIDRMQAANRVRATEIGSEYLSRLTHAFISLGLTEDQEARLASMAQDAYARLDGLLEESRFIGDLLREVTAHLDRLVAA